MICVGGWAAGHSGQWGMDGVRVCSYCHGGLSTDVCVVGGVGVCDRV